MSVTRWAKQARQLAKQHSHTINAGIDQAADTAKRRQPTKSSSIDKAARAAKAAVNKS